MEDPAGPEPGPPLVAILMGSRSDWETMRAASEVLAGLGVPHESRVVSAHRTPDRLYRFAREAESRGLMVIIAGAGGAAHLPGMIAALTIVPVLGVPVESKVLRGVDSLLSIVQMPRGVPVGTLAIGAAGAANAGLLAAAILARHDRALRDRLANFRAEQTAAVDESSDMSRAAIAPPSTLGVIGGGQLGRMFLQAAQRMGFRTVVLSAIADGPAAQVAHESLVAPPEKLAALEDFARRAEAVTVEFENVSAPALRWLARRRPIRPGWKTVWTCQDRIREKSFLSRHGLPHAPWRPIRTDSDLAAVDLQLGLPLILKTSTSGYDGKGQARVGSADDLPSAWAGLGRVDCVAEAVVSFEAELSVVVARGVDGRSETFPVAMNRHDRHILDSTIMPAPIGPVVARDAREMAVAAAEALGTVGVLTVEFFLTSEGRLLVNEMAPRPHNSGHLTIEAAATSQFEQQVRALAGLPLGSADLVTPAAMVNLLGDLWYAGEPRWADALGSDPGVKLHLYGKRTASAGRKMGHLTVLDPDPDRALARALRARGLLNQAPKN